MYFVSPYFDHVAFMHHTMHVLDAPVGRLPKWPVPKRRYQIFGYPRQQMLMGKHHFTLQCHN